MSADIIGLIRLSQARKIASVTRRIGRRHFPEFELRESLPMPAKLYLAPKAVARVARYSLDFSKKISQWDITRARQARLKLQEVAMHMSSLVCSRSYELWRTRLRGGSSSCDSRDSCANCSSCFCFSPSASASQFLGFSSSSSARRRSASSAAMHPEPAEVMAWRYRLSWTSPAAKTPLTLVSAVPGMVTM